MSIYNPYQPYYQQPQYIQQNTPTQQPQQIQSGGFVSVRNEIEARNYPVAPGNSVTFIDENAPYCYTKTMGFSQLDRPRFEKFRLVKEEEQAPPTNEVQYALKADIEALKGDISHFHSEYEALKAKMEEILGGEKNGE